MLPWPLWCSLQQGSNVLSLTLKQWNGHYFQYEPIVVCHVPFFCLLVGHTLVCMCLYNRASSMEVPCSRMSVSLALLWLSNLVSIGSSLVPKGSSLVLESSGRQSEHFGIVTLQKNRLLAMANSHTNSRGYWPLATELTS